MDCKSLYLGIQEKVQLNVLESLETKNLIMVASAHSFVEDYKKWVSWIDERYNNELFALAILEYETAIVLGLQSLYKQAFTALRACLEHTLFGILLSTNLFKYKKWKNGACDVYWSNIIDKDCGLFSKTYINAFCPEMCDAAALVCNLGKTLYRECSEYIHGNYKIANSYADQIVYDEEHLQLFFKKIESLIYIIEFSLFTRFQGEFSLEDVRLYEPQLMEYLGHLQEINEYLSISHEGE